MLALYSYEVSMEVYKGKRITISAGSLTKIDQLDNFTRAFSRLYRDRGQR